MARTIKMCTIIPIPLEKREEANLHAIEINPDNFVASNNAIEAAADSRRLWPNGSTLKVHFIEGDPAVIKRVQPILEEWSQYANIKFQFSDDVRAEIRVAFDPKTGSWS